METITEHLQRRTWRELRMTAHAHGLPFNTHYPKARACQYLVQSLHSGQLRRSLRALGQSERAALVALQAAGGSLPQYRFTAVFGAIRPFRPWREDAPRAPWRRPVSPAERLWFLGFIHIYKGEQDHQRRVTLPAEVLALLPPLPRPRAKPQRLPHGAASPDQLLIDVAALVGTLSGRTVKPRWHRWLPPHALKAINARLSLPEHVAGVRSELHTDRLRFVHYLAEVAGLIDLQNGRVMPTPAAWRWLDLPAPERWRWLWEALSRDLEGDQPLWVTYRFAPISPQVWAALTDQLRRLVPARTYTIRSLGEALKPYVLDGPHPQPFSLREKGEDGALLAAVPEVLRGPLAWAGMVTVQGDCLMLTKAGHAALRGQTSAFAAVENARLAVSEQAIMVELPTIPRARSFAELCAWAAPDSGGWRVDAESVSRAVALGYDSEGIARLLGNLCGQMPPPAVFEQIAAWVSQASQLVLRPMTVLSSPDAALLARLRQDVRLRRMFAEPLSDHHAAVHPHAVAVLRNALERRGHRVTARTGVEPATGREPGPSDYLWLAVSTYRRLGALVDVPVRIPGAVEADLAARLSASQIEALEQAAEAICVTLARAIDGYSALSPPIAQDDPVAIRAAVSAAYQHRAALTVEYFSPGYGAATVRTITPILPITESGGAEYVEAWCETAGAARTFRLDRILRIVGER